MGEGEVMGEGCGVGGDGGGEENPLRERENEIMCFVVFHTHNVHLTLLTVDCIYKYLFYM